MGLIRHFYLLIIHKKFRIQLHQFFFFSKMSCKIPCHKHFCHFIIISLNCIQDIFMVSYHIIMLSGLLCCFFILYCFTCSLPTRLSHLHTSFRPRCFLPFYRLNLNNTIYYQFSASRSPSFHLR